MEPKNEIAEELKELAPYLASLSRRHPFTVPGDYFEWLEEQIAFATGSAVKSEFIEALPEIDHPFEVPDGYFEELPAKIISLIKQEQPERTPVKTVPIGRNFSPARIWLAAASVALLVTTTYLLWNQQQSSNLVSEQTNEASAVGTSSDEVDLLENAVGIDEGMVVELLLDDQSANPSMTNQDNYDPSLIDVSDIDDELIEEI